MKSVVATETLHTVAEDVDYEIWMFMAIGERYRHKRLKPADALAKRALVESWLLHLRNLWVFFEEPRGSSRPDAVRAGDFVVDEGEFAESLARVPTDILAEQKRIADINRVLMDASARRRQRDARWREEDHHIVEKRLRAFFRILPVGRRSWFHRSQHWFDPDVGTAAPAEAPSPHPPRDVPIPRHFALGTVALVRNMLGPADVARVLLEQKKRPDERFGKLAVQLGLLTESQLEELLLAQQEGLFTDEEMREARRRLEEFRQPHR
ncbi:MAG: hypothetical protein ACE5JR_04010 [Gemmatimonadota bacterium]